MNSLSPLPCQALLTQARNHLACASDSVIKIRACCCCCCRCTLCRRSWGLHYILRWKGRLRVFPLDKFVGTGCGPYKQNLVSQLQSIKLLCPDAVDSNAEGCAAPLAACSTSQQGSTEQVSFVEVSVNGQASSLHSSRSDARHVEHGVLGHLPSSVYFADNSQALDFTACIVKINKTQLQHDSL